MRDVARHLVMLLVDVAVEHGDIRMGHQQLDRLRTVARRPIPLWIKVEQRTMRENDDRRVPLLHAQISLQPGQLRLADPRGRIRDVVQRDEMHALVVEAVMRRPEELGPRFAAVERCIMLAGHEADVLILQPASDLLELRQPPPPLGRVVSRVREITGEHNEVRLHRQGVDCPDGSGQRGCGFRIERGSVEAPMGVG